jgi:hypothetical protein
VALAKLEVLLNGCVTWRSELTKVNCALHSLLVLRLTFVTSSLKVSQVSSLFHHRASVHCMSRQSDDSLGRTATLQHASLLMSLTDFVVRNSTMLGLTRLLRGVNHLMLRV